MADNVAITAGTGTTVHADEYTHSTLGSGKTQLVKLVDGTLDSSTAIAAGGGVEAGALRVTIASDSTGQVKLAAGTASIGTLAANSGVDIGDVTINNATIAVTQSGTWDEVGINDSGNSITVDNGGTFVVQENGAALTSLQLIDDTVYTDGTGTPSKAIGVAGTDGTNPQILKTDTSGELQVDVLTMPTVTVTATNLDVQSGGADLATFAQGAAIQTAVETIDNAISGSEMQVDVVGALPAGTNAIGKLAANSGVDIGDVTLNNATIAVTQSGTWDEVGINDSGNSITIDVNGTAVSSTNPLLIGAMAIQDTGNSTTATLGSGGNFTGTAFDLNSYSSWSINIFSDKASSSNGLVVQWSDDGTNWDFSDAITYVASVGNMITFGRKARYVRLNYTNTNSAQTVFRVTAYAQPLSVRQTRKFVGSAISDGETGQVVIAGIQGHTTAGGGAWVDVKVSPSGSLSANVSGSTLGANSGVDIGDVTINNASGASAVNIQDGGNTITVDGTVTANLAAGTNNIGDVDILSIAAGDNNIGNVDVVTLPSLPAGTNAIGKLAANSGVDIGDVTLTAGTDAIGKLLPPDVDVTTHTNYARKYYTNSGAVTDGIIWSPASGKRWHVTTLYIQVSAVATVTLEDDKAGGDDPVWKGELAANSGVVLPFTEKYPMASGEDAADLLITTTAGNVYVTAVGYEI